MNQKAQRTGTALMCLLVLSMAVGFAYERYALNQVLETFVTKDGFNSRLVMFYLSNSVTVDSSGKILGAGHRVEEMFGYERGELKDKHVTILMAKEDQPRHQEKFVARLQEPNLGQTVEVRCLGLRKDKTRFPIEIRTEAVQDGSDIVFLGSLKNADAVVELK